MASYLSAQLPDLGEVAAWAQNQQNGTEPMAGASGTFAHYEPNVMNPISSLALKAEKQEAEGGDRKWLAGDGTTRVSCGGQHLWLGTQVRTTSQPQLPRDFL